MARRLFILLLLVASAGWAQEPRPIVIGEIVPVHSDVLGEDRELMVSTPASYQSSDSRYPVVYLLDAETNFQHTTGTLGTLAQIDFIPEMLVVAVRNTDRTRDLTPSPFTPDPPKEGEKPEVNPMPTAGGADRFLDFFEQELFPFVEGRYRAARYRILIGHSFGGLFAVHALVHRPADFDAYVAISPSLWWEKGALVDQAAEVLGNGAASGRKVLFMSLASEGGDMLAQYRRFEELLRYRAPASWRWEARMMEGDDHGSTPIRSTYFGLRTVFPRWRPPSFLADAGLEGYERHYAELSQEYGYEIGVPENVVNRLGYRLLGEKKIDEAVAVFRQNVEDHPGSANVYDSLGDALKEKGELEAALASYERACELGGESDHPEMATFKKNRDELRAQLGRDPAQAGDPSPPEDP